MDHLPYLNNAAQVIRSHVRNHKIRRRMGVARGRMAIGMGADPKVIATSLATPVPLSDVLTPAVVGAVTQAFTQMDPAASAAGVDTTAVQQGISAAAKAVDGQALDAARSAIAANLQPAFDAGIALAAGAAKAAEAAEAQGFALPVMTPAAAQAGWLLAQGLSSAPADLRSAVAAVIMQNPDLKAGATLSDVASVGILAKIEELWHDFWTWVMG